MNVKFFNSKEKKQISNMLKQDFGIEHDFKSELILESGKGKLWLCNEEYRKAINLPYRIETIGLYFAQIDKNGELRLSVEGAIRWGKDATKKVIELDEKQKDYWIRGINLDYSGEERGYIIIRYGKDILGCGKAFSGGILNHVPKERRIRNLI